MRMLTGLILICLGLALAPAEAQRVDPQTPRRNIDNDDNFPTTRGRVDAAILRGGRLEYIAIGPPGQSQAAADALAGAGAQVLRIRAYGALNRRALVVDLRRLTLAQARALLAQAAPQTVIDAQAFYRYAQGRPRLYAARMIGAGPSPCRLGGLRVGLIDGPVDPSHAALRQARIRVQSVLLPNERPADASHGTAVAALIVGQDPDGALTGYAGGAQLFAASAFARERRGPAADVERIGAALDWLIGSGVRLINMSFAGPPNAALADLLGAAAGRGALMVAAAGNDGKSSEAWPAAASPVIAVTAVDAAGRRYRSANTGAHIEFAAPGVDLYVARPRGGTYASGTSYAAPIVTALAARHVARGTRSAAALRAALRRNSADLGAPGRDTDYGWGLVRATGC